MTASRVAVGAHPSPVSAGVLPMEAAAAPARSQRSEVSHNLEARSKTCQSNQGVTFDCTEGTNPKVLRSITCPTAARPEGAVGVRREEAPGFGVLGDLENGEHNFRSFGGLLCSLLERNELPQERGSVRGSPW